MASTAARLASMAASRSASAPDRPNLACSASPRLDRYMAWSGWSVGVASTAARMASMAASRSASAPDRSNLACSASPGCTGIGVVGVVGGGGLHRRADGLNRCLQVGQRPGPLEPGLQRDPQVGQHRGVVGVVGGGGLHRRRPASIAASRSASAPDRSNRTHSATPRLDRYMARLGWSVGVASTAARPIRIAASRSASAPDRSNLARSATPRLDRCIAWSGWPVGVASTAARGARIAASRSASAPDRSNLACSAVPRLDRYRGVVGVVGGGGLHRRTAGLDRRVQVGQRPGPLEPDLQRGPQVGQVHRGVVGVVGGGGLHRRDGRGFNRCSRSASAPDRSNLTCSAIPRLDRTRRGWGGRWGWPPPPRGWPQSPPPGRPAPRTART